MCGLILQPFGIAGILHRTDTNLSIDHNSFDVDTVSNDSFAYCYFHSKIHSFATKLQPFFFQMSLDFLLLASLFIVKSLPSFSNFQNNTCLQNNSNETETNTHKLNCRKGVMICLVIGIVLHVPFLAMALIIRFVFVDNINALSEVWQTLVILQKLVMSFVILFAFSHLQSFKTDSSVWRLESSDIVFLSCYVGKVVLHAFEIIAAIYCLESRILLGRGLISVVFYFYQTLYILITKRCSRSFFKQSKEAVSVHVLLLITSVTLWITTTFILSVQGNYVLNEGVGCLFENSYVWKMLQYISVPFTMYYDLQSAMHFYSFLPSR